jgi:hypothetical protein
LEDFTTAVQGKLPNPNRIDITTYSIMWRSELVEGWLRHISKWAKKHVDERGKQEQFGALILRRPRMPYGKSVVIIDGMDMPQGAWTYWAEEGFRQVHKMEAE